MLTKGKRQFRPARPKRAARGQRSSAHAREATHAGEPTHAGTFCIKVLALVGNITTSKPTIALVSA
jgi:hypothetical protein